MPAFFIDTHVLLVPDLAGDKSEWDTDGLKEVHPGDPLYAKYEKSAKRICDMNPAEIAKFHLEQYAARGRKPAKQRQAFSA